MTKAEIQSIKAKNIDIQFIERIRYPLYFIFKVKIVNNGSKKEIIRLSDITCNSGVNVLYKGKTHINGIDLLESVELGKNESIETYIAFEKISFVLTNQPNFQYNGTKTKVKITKLSHKG